MGSIRQRKLSDGTVRYRAEIRIKKQDYPPYTESRTFNTRRSADNWLKKREAEIQDNPEILNGVESKQDIYITKAIDRYIEEVGREYGRTKIHALRLLQRLPIAKKSITKLKASDLAEHVALRKNGIKSLGLQPIAASTQQHELLHLRSVISHAGIMWDLDVNLNAFDKATAQLRKTRQISASKRRDRVLTNEELYNLTKFFCRKWYSSKYSTIYPMHLIIWFAIFSCRRESEITRLELNDYDTERQLFKVCDLKNPNGSKGNNKVFKVLEPCKKIIDIVMSDSIRNKMLSKSNNKQKDEKYLFPLNPKTIGGEFRDACKILGIEDLRFHDLRHDGCTRLAEQGFTIPQIQQISLHDSWGSLERYVSVNNRKDVLVFDDLLRVINDEA